MPALKDDLMLSHLDSYSKEFWQNVKTNINNFAINMNSYTKINVQIHIRIILKLNINTQTNK